MTSQRITEISVTPIPARYPHEIARNAYNWGHGSIGIEWLTRARTDGGVEGLAINKGHLGAIGRDGSVADAMNQLKAVFLGKRLDELLTYPMAASQVQQRRRNAHSVGRDG